ncbi:YfhO family protein [Flavobacteriaceae bacterium]|nr:YfhO family protein [Flavobacteriaceae bacterium]
MYLKIFKNIVPHVICIIFLASLSLTYFYPVLSNKAISQSDISQFSGMSKQIVDHRIEFDEEPYWLDNAFLGMPSFQVSAIYPFDILRIIDQFIRFLPRPADYLFLYLLSFYLLIISLNIRYKYALFGAIAFGFSTYLIIILGVGHNTKALALGYMPLVVSGFIMTLNNKHIEGFIITAISLGLQIHSNHYQMTFYTLIMLMFLVAVYLYNSLKKSQSKIFFKSFFVLFSSVIISVLMNAPAILSTMEYSEFSTRSKNEITINPDGSLKESVSGLDKNYITEYSYGILESINLFVPKFMGGSSAETIKEDSELMSFIKTLDPQQGQQVYQYSKMYWGDQPIVAAPAYIGATVLFVFFLGLLLVKNINMRWIMISIVVSLILSWGKNLSFLTDFMIDYFPMYDKFRAVSSIQVILEFCIPFLAVFGLQKFFAKNTDNYLKTRALYFSGLTLGLVSLSLYLFGANLFDFKSSFEIFADYPEILNLIIDERKSLLKEDSLRSFIFIISIFSILFIYSKKFIKKNLAIYSIIILVIIDLWQVDKQYVNSDQFVNQSSVNSPFKLTVADKAILQDNSDFRVFEPERGFSNARTSFFHKSIAGYHAAKPKRIQNIYDFYILKNNLDVLNILNVKYIIQNDPNNPLGVTRNPNALGNAWFVDGAVVVENDNQELLSLSELDLSKKLVTQNKSLIAREFKLRESNTITLSSRKANELIYKSSTESSQLAVFSEAFYKNGWQAYVDGIKVDHFRVNYLLRGLILPEGDHEVKFNFKPKVVYTGSYISIVAYLILLILMIKFILNKKNV